MSAQNKTIETVEVDLVNPEILEHWTNADLPALKTAYECIDSEINSGILQGKCYTQERNYIKLLIESKSLFMENHQPTLLEKLTALFKSMLPISILNK